MFLCPYSPELLSVILYKQRVSLYEFQLELHTNTFTTRRIGWHNQHNSPAWYVCYEKLTTTMRARGRFPGGRESGTSARTLTGRGARCSTNNGLSFPDYSKSYISWAQLRTSLICQESLQNTGPYNLVTGSADVTLSFSLRPSYKFFNEARRFGWRLFFLLQARNS